MKHAALALALATMAAPVSAGAHDVSSGPVVAAMNGGSLGIDSQGQAACADGSSYDMPQVTCATGAQSIADCTGSYGNERFPMSMRRAGE